jgi:hypothetical protein
MFDLNVYCDGDRLRAVQDASSWTEIALREPECFQWSS